MITVQGPGRRACLGGLGLRLRPWGVTERLRGVVTNEGSWQGVPAACLLAAAVPGLIVFWQHVCEGEDRPPRRAHLLVPGAGRGPARGPPGAAARLGKPRPPGLASSRRGTGTTPPPGWPPPPPP